MGRCAVRRRQVDKVEAGFRFWLESKGLAEGTVRNYLYAAATWRTWCDENEVAVTDPDREDLQAYLGDLLKHRSTGSVDLLKIGLRRFFTYLIDTKKYAGANPVTDLHIKKRETEPAEPFTREELHRMYIACQNHQERAVFLLLVGGGLRRSEIYGIRRDDVNLEEGTIRVLGKGHQYRLSAPGRVVIEAAMAAMEFSERLCPQGSNEIIIRIVKTLAERAQIRGRIYPHRFRHSFAVLFLENGGTIDDLMHILGHKRVEQSLYYSRARARRRAVEAQARVNVAETLLGLTPRPVLLPTP